MLAAAAVEIAAREGADEAGMARGTWFAGDGDETVAASRNDRQREPVVARKDRESARAGPATSSIT